MKKAFTILELLVVVSIIAILAVAAIPNFIGRIQSAEDSKFVAEVNSVQKATSIFREEEGYFPTEQELQPTDGFPMNIKFNLLVSGGYLSKLPSSSYWYIDNRGMVVHTEEKLEEYAGEVYKCNKTDISVRVDSLYNMTKEHPEHTYSEVGNTGGDTEEPPVTIAKIVMGEIHTIFIKTDGTAWAAGLNDRGQLGDGTTENKSTPVQVQGLSEYGKVVDAAAGTFHSVFLMEDGTVRSVGWNYYGQLGDGTLAERHIPVAVPGLIGVKELDASDYNTLFVMEDGTVKGTGINHRGQLGDGTLNNRNTPTNMVGLETAGAVKDISAGSEHTVILTDDGKVWATGYGNSGQLGGIAQTSTPIEIGSISSIGKVTQIASGDWHTLYLMENGAVYGLGDSTSGQLGINSYSKVSSPQQVQTIEGYGGVKQIAAGDWHSIFVTNSGSVLATGNNNKGQLGDGTTATRLFPVVMQGTNSLAGIKQVLAGYHDTILLMGDGSVKGTGYNVYGEFGNGTTTGTLTLTDILLDW